MKIVADNKIPFLRGVFETAGCEVIYAPGRETSAEMVCDADAVITRTRTRCGKALLEGSRVKIAATATIGLDHFNTAELDELGITWCNAPGCNSSSVAQYIASVLVTFGNYSGKTLGVIGAGNVGKKVINTARILGMNVLVNDPPRAEKEGGEGFVSLDEIAEKSDFVTVHVPLEYEGDHPTFHLCGSEFFRKMKDGAVFINSSRGEAVDTSSLLDALKSGRISKCALDVWENEPDIDRELLERADAATPHIAGYSLDGKANGTVSVVRAVARKLGIEALHNWDCQGIVPLPDSGTRIVIPAGASDIEAVKYAVLYTYDVMRDTRDFKSSPEKFEELRGNYYVRREFPAFQVENAAEGAAEILHDLGFMVV